MKSQNITYAAFSDQGVVRRNNQDNLYCGQGRFLEENNTGTGKLWAGELAPDREVVFGVFDGMGGEKGGETAAYIAARKMNEMAALRSAGDQAAPDTEESFLEKYCLSSNNEIDHVRRQKKYRAMGTTAAMIMIDGKNVVVCNVGDSRIYCYSEGKLTQLSVDHTMPYYLFGNAPLTQYLGVPEEEMLIEPFITTREYQPGDQFLLCTDGVWRGAFEEAVSEFFASEESGEKKMKKLRSWIEENDGTDNATAVWIRLP